MSVSPVYRHVRDLLLQYREGKRNARARVLGQILIGIKALEGAERRAAAVGLKEAFAAAGRTPITVEEGDGRAHS